MTDIYSIELNIDIKECEDRASKIFLRQSGLGSVDDEKNREMRAEAFQLCDSLRHSIKPRAVYRYCKDMELKGRCLTIRADDFEDSEKGTSHIAIECSAFELIDVDSVEGAYIYGVTAGEQSLYDKYLDSSLSLLKQLYMDMWGTAYTDAARKMILGELSRNLSNGVRLSESFGPGYYGMDVKEMTVIGQLLDLKAIGVEVGHGGLLFPEKSCAGIVFAVNRKYSSINSACQSCLGNKKSCTLCGLTKD